MITESDSFTTIDLGSIMQFFLVMLARISAMKMQASVVQRCLKAAYNPEPT